MEEKAQQDATAMKRLMLTIGKRYLRERGIEPPHKKHYGDTDGNKV